MATITPEMQQLLDDLAKLGINVDELNKQMSKSTIGLNAQIKLLCERLITANKAFKDLNASMGKASSSVTGHADALDDAAKQRSKNSKKETQEDEQRSRSQQQIHADMKKALGNFGINLGKTGMIVASGLYGIVKGAAAGAMAGRDALAVSAGAMEAQIDATNDVAQAGASALTAVANASVGATGGLRYAGLAAGVAGAAISVLGKETSDLAKKGIQFLLAETYKALDGFRTMTSVGAVYTDGMIGMSNVANGAGLTLEEFSKAVAGNKEKFTQMGLGASEGSKRLAKAMKEGGEASRRGMFALGMGMEEQAALYTDIMAKMAGPEGKLTSNDSEIKEAAADYAANLKQIAAITGQDVKAKKEAARKDIDQLFMQKELAKIKDPKKRAKAEAMLEQMDDSRRTALIENLKYGAVVTDSLAVAQSMSGGIAKSNQKILESWNNQTSSIDDYIAIEESTADERRESALKVQGIDIANSKIAVETSSILAKDLKGSVAFSKEAVANAKAEKEAALAAAKSGKGVKGNEAVDLMDQQQTLKIAMAKEASNNLEEFSKQLQATSNAMLGSIKAITSGSTKMGMVMGELLSPTFLLTIASTIAAPFIQAMILKRTFGGGPPVPTPGGGGGGGGPLGGGGGGLGNLGKNIGDIGKGIGSGATKILIGLARGLKALGSPAVLKGVAALGLMGAAMFVAGKALNQFNTVEWPSVAKGIVTLGGLAAVSQVLGRSSTAMITGAAGLIALGAALWTTAQGLKEFSNVEWESIVKGTIAIGGLAVVSKLLGTSTPSMILGAIGIAALGGAMWGAGKGFQQFADVSWESMLKGAVAIGAMAIAATALSAVAGPMIVGSLGVAAFGAALWVAGKGLQSLNDVNWDSVDKAGSSLGWLGLKLGLATPFMIAGAVGVTVLGAALWVASKGITAIADSVGKLTGGDQLTALGTSLAAFYEAVPFLSLALRVPAMYAIGAGLTALGPGVDAIKGDGTNLLTLGYSLKKFYEDVPFLKLAGVAELFMPAIGRGLTALGPGVDAIKSDGSNLKVLGASLKKFYDDTPFKNLAGVAEFFMPTIGRGLTALGPGVDAIKSDGSNLLTLGSSLKKFYDDTPFFDLWKVTPFLSSFGEALFPLARGLSLIPQKTLGLDGVGKSLASFYEDTPFYKLSYVAPLLQTFGEAMFPFASALSKVKAEGDAFDKINAGLSKFQDIDIKKVTDVSNQLAKSDLSSNLRTSESSMNISRLLKEQSAYGAPISADLAVAQSKNTLPSNLPTISGAVQKTTNVLGQENKDKKSAFAKLFTPEEDEKGRAKDEMAKSDLLLRAVENLNATLTKTFDLNIKSVELQEEMLDLAGSTRGISKRMLGAFSN